MSAGARARKEALEAHQRLDEWDAVVEKVEQVAQRAKRVKKRAINGHRLGLRSDGQEPGESS